MIVNTPGLRTIPKNGSHRKLAAGAEIKVAQAASLLVVIKPHFQLLNLSLFPSL